MIRSNRDFRRLFAAHAISRAGDAFHTVALVVLVFNLTGSGLSVAGTVAFEVLPVLLLGPVVGLVVDRYPRRSLLVLADLLRAALALVVALFGQSVAVAYAVAFGLSALTVLFNPAAASLLPEVVESDDLVDANAALWTSAVVAQIILAPLAGVLIAVHGTAPAFGLNAASYILSAALLAGLRSGRAPAATGRGGWRDVLAGAHTVRAHPLLARLAIVQLLAALSAGATSGLLVVLAAARLGVGPSGFGLLLGAIGLGAALGPLLLRRLIRVGDRRWLFGPYAVRGVADLTLATTASPAVAAPALAVYGVATSTGMVAYQSTLQHAVAAETRGRVFALFDVIWQTARLASLGLGGLLADVGGIQVVYALGGVLLLIAAGVGWQVPRKRPDLIANSPV